MYEKPKAKSRAEKERARQFRLQPGQQWHRGARVTTARKPDRFASRAEARRASRPR